MPVEIEAACSGFRIMISDRRTEKFVRADDLKAVHHAIDHHYWRYSNNGDRHRKGKVEGCPLCGRS